MAASARVSGMIKPAGRQAGFCIALFTGLALLAGSQTVQAQSYSQPSPQAEIEAYLSEAAADQARERAIYGSLSNPEILAGRESRLQARLAAQLNGVAAREAAYGPAQGQQAVAYIAARAPAFAAGAQRAAQLASPAPAPALPGTWYAPAAGYGPASPPIRPTQYVAAEMPASSNQRPGGWYDNPYLARYGFGVQPAAASQAYRTAPMQSLAAAPSGGASSRGGMVSGTGDDIWDPLEPMNRAFYAFNEVVDTFLLRPVAWLYSFAPDAVKTGVRNALSNLNTPVTFLNHGLQAEFSHAATTVGRFVVNSTVGVLGLWDAADDLLDWKGKPADFGQTLHSYGVGDGPFLMLPLLGPSNLRDGVGAGVGMLADPLTYILNDNARLALTGTKVVSRREALLVPLDELKAGSLDYYSALRSSSQQNRRAFLQGGKPADAATLKRTDDLFNEVE